MIDMNVMRIGSIKSSLSGEKFFVDTNIWLYQSYVSGAFFSEHSQEKAANYSDFISKRFFLTMVNYLLPLFV